MILKNVEDISHVIFHPWFLQIHGHCIIWNMYHSTSYIPVVFSDPKHLVNGATHVKHESLTVTMPHVSSSWKCFCRYRGMFLPVVDISQSSQIWKQDQSSQQAFLLGKNNNGGSLAVLIKKVIWMLFNLSFMSLFFKKKAYWASCLSGNNSVSSRYTRSFTLLWKIEHASHRRDCGSWKN